MLQRGTHVVVLIHSMTEILSDDDDWIPSQAMRKEQITVKEQVSQVVEEAYDEDQVDDDDEDEEEIELRYEGQYVRNVLAGYEDDSEVRVVAANNASNKTKAAHAAKAAKARVANANEKSTSASSSAQAIDEKKKFQPSTKVVRCAGSVLTVKHHSITHQSLIAKSTWNHSVARRSRDGKTKQIVPPLNSFWIRALA
jgi:hypothetical protein